MQHVSKILRKHIHLGTGNIIYGTLGKLEKEGLIVAIRDTYHQLMEDAGWSKS